MVTIHSNVPCLFCFLNVCTFFTIYAVVCTFGLIVQVITNIDVQNIEPIDLNMRESLAKSVQMAIEIATR